MINTRHEKYQQHNDVDYKSCVDKFYNSYDDNTDTGDEDDAGIYPSSFTNVHF